MKNQQIRPVGEIIIPQLHKTLVSNPTRWEGVTGDHQQVAVVYQCGVVSVLLMIPNGFGGSSIEEVLTIDEARESYLIGKMDRLSGTIPSRMMGEARLFHSRGKSLSTYRLRETARNHNRLVDAGYARGPKLQIGLSLRA